MKYLILVLALTVAMPAYSGSKEAKAIGKAAAARHPQGSGIGTNRYNVRYNQNYKVEGFQRVDQYGRGYPDYYLPPKGNK